MKSKTEVRMTAIVMLMLMVLMLCAFSGCTSPMSTAFAVRTTFNQTTGDLTTLHTGPAGMFTDTEFHAINQQEHAVAPLLDALDAAAIKAEANHLNVFATFDYNAALSAALKELDLLATKRAAATSKK